MRVMARPSGRSDGRGKCRLVVPASAAVRLGLDGGGRVPLRFGGLLELAEVTVSGEDRGGLLEVPSSLQNLIPSGFGLALGRTVNRRELRLGPIIGVITTHAAARPRVTSTLGPQNSSLRGLALAGRKLGAIVQVFPPAGVRWRHQVVGGYVLTPGPARGGQWRLGWLPFPDVIYNRIPTRSAERQPLARSTCRRLEARLGNRFFNPGFLDKWQVHRLLEGRAETAAYLPAAARYGRGSLAAMLRRYPVLYLKQVGGSLGLGIIRVDHAGSSRFIVRHQRRPGRVRRLAVRGAGGLRLLLRRLIGTRRYIVQQGLALATFQGRVYDVRALAQKDGRGLWTVTGMAARVARPGGIATHVPNGGTREPVLRVLRESFGADDRVRPILAELERAALVLAAAVDAGSGRRFGELSLDLAVDQEGQVWVLEINAKPFRFDEDSIREQAWTQLVRYSRHLAEFDPVAEDGGDEARAP